MRPGLQERACKSEFGFFSEDDYSNNANVNDGTDAGEPNLEPQFKVDKDNDSGVDAESEAELSELLGGGDVGGEARARAPEQDLGSHTAAGREEQAGGMLGKSTTQLICRPIGLTEPNTNDWSLPTDFSYSYLLSHV